MTLQGLYQNGWYEKVLASDGGIPVGMSVDRNISAFAVAALLLSALTLGGCASSIADLPVVGMPADAPERPKEPGAYLPVHDLPPDRGEAAMPPAERAKIEAELLAARDRQASTVTGHNSAPK